MIILEDKGQTLGKHVIKNDWFKENGIEVMRAPLPVGDYVLMNERTQDVINRKSKRNIDLKKMDFLGTYTISVDTKKDLSEIYNNLVGKSHARFRDECILAQNNGIKLIILCEHSNRIKTIDDVRSWENPRIKAWEKEIKKLAGFDQKYSVGSAINYLKQNKIRFRKGPMTGNQIADIMETMTVKYGVKWLFCDKVHTGQMIVELLSREV